MSFDINACFPKLNDQNVLLSYKGSITSDVINQLLESIENKLTEANVDIKVRKKIYNVLVESLQNLFHHVEDLPVDFVEGAPENRFGVIYILHVDKGYRISTGNFINSSRIKPLKDKIDKINSLSQDELKDMYKFILNHQKLTAKGGGGLGLVDIARKTGNKIEYSFHNYNNDYYFFNLDIHVS